MKMNGRGKEAWRSPQAEVLLSTLEHQKDSQKSFQNKSNWCVKPSGYDLCYAKSLNHDFIADPQYAAFTTNNLNFLNKDMGNWRDLPFLHPQ